MGRARKMEDVARAAVRRHAAHWRVPEAADDIELETIERRNGAWVTSVKRNNTMRGFDDTEDLEFKLHSMDLTRDSLRIIAHKTFAAIRHRLRQRALIQAGESEDARPAWSLTLPRVQMSVLRMLDIDPADHLPDVVALRDALSGRGWNGSFTMTDGDFHSAYMSSTGEAKLSIWWEWPTRVRIEGVDLPNTAVQALKGRDLHNVIAMDFDIRAGPVKVLRSTIDRNDFTGPEINLGIAPLRSTLAPVPRGVDRSWLSVPWVPKTPAF